MINASSGKLDFDGIDVNLGLELLAIFWNRQHYEAPFVYRPAFMRSMAEGGPYFSKLLLYAIMFAASRHTASPQVRSDPSDPDSAGIPFRRKFEGLLYEPGSNTLFQSKVTTVQALLIFANILLSWRDETRLAWHYTGVAINMILELGIHAERHTLHLTDNYSAEDLEVHRRTFWAAFSTLPV